MSTEFLLLHTSGPHTKLNNCHKSSNDNPSGECAIFGVISWIFNCIIFLSGGNSGSHHSSVAAGVSTFLLFFLSSFTYAHAAVFMFAVLVI